MLTSANSKSKSKSQPQQEVSTMPKAKFKPYLLEKFEVDGGMEESSTNIPILVAHTFLPTVDLVDY